MSTKGWFFSFLVLAALTFSIWYWNGWESRTPDMTESGVILLTAYEPDTSGHAISPVLVPSRKGLHLGIAITPTGHEEHYAVQFRCAHGSVFTITDKPTYDACAGHANESVRIVYREVWKTYHYGFPNEYKELADYEFVRAFLWDAVEEGR